MARTFPGGDRRQADTHLFSLAGTRLRRDAAGSSGRVAADRARSHGMPFGLQIVGPRGGDAFVLSVAAELEALLAGDQRTARPVPDLARLKSTRPISEMDGFHPNQSIVAPSRARACARVGNGRSPGNQAGFMIQ